MQREQAALKCCSRCSRSTGETKFSQAQLRKTARTRRCEACKNLSEATEPASSATDPFVFQSRRPDLDSDEEAADIQTGDAAISSDDDAEHEVILATTTLGTIEPRRTRCIRCQVDLLDEAFSQKTIASITHAAQWPESHPGGRQWKCRACTNETVQEEESAKAKRCSRCGRSRFETLITRKQLRELATSRKCEECRRQPETVDNDKKRSDPAALASNTVVVETQTRKRKRSRSPETHLQT